MPNENNKTDMAILKTKVEYIERGIDSIKGQLADMQKRYITKEEFEPVKKIVYGLVSLILVSVIGAIVALILK